MSDSEPFQRAHATALRFLSYRLRSESEVRTRLLRNFSPQLVEDVLLCLKEGSLLDDARFAGSWRDSRVSLRPRSAAAIKRELVSKGIDRTTADDTVREVDDEENAYRAGLKAARRASNLDSVAFRRKLWGYLQRRGFGASVSRRVIAQLWQEKQEVA